MRRFKNDRASLDAVQTQKDATGAALAEAIQQEQAARLRQEGLEAVKRSSPEWTAAVSQLYKTETRAATAGDKDCGSSAELLTMEKHHAEDRKAFERLKDALATEQALASQRARLLAELRQTLQSSETRCPFCGYSYDSYAELLAHMGNVQEAPTENHRLAAGKVQHKQNEVVSLQHQIEFRRKEIADLERQKSENFERQNAISTQLSQIRDRAVLIGVIPKDAGAATIPEVAHIDAKLADTNLPNIQRKLQELQAQQQSLRSKADAIQETAKAMNAERDALVVRIEQRRAVVSSLHDQAEDAGALEFLPLSQEDTECKVRSPSADPSGNKYRASRGRSQGSTSCS